VGGRRAQGAWKEKRKEGIEDRKEKREKRILNKESRMLKGRKNFWIPASAGMTVVVASGF